MEFGGGRGEEEGAVDGDGVTRHADAGVVGVADAHVALRLESLFLDGAEAFGVLLLVPADKEEGENGGRDSEDNGPNEEVEEEGRFEALAGLCLFWLENFDGDAGLEERCVLKADLAEDDWDLRRVGSAGWNGACKGLVEEALEGEQLVAGLAAGSSGVGRGLVLRTRLAGVVRGKEVLEVAELLFVHLSTQRVLQHQLLLEAAQTDRPLRDHLRRRLHHQLPSLRTLQVLRSFVSLLVHHHLQALHLVPAHRRRLYLLERVEQHVLLPRQLHPLQFLTHVAMASYLSNLYQERIVN